MHPEGEGRVPECAGVGPVLLPRTARVPQGRLAPPLPGRGRRHTPQGKGKAPYSHNPPHPTPFFDCDIIATIGWRGSRIADFDR